MSTENATRGATMTTTRWIVEMLDEEGNTSGHIFDDVAALGDFVRVNACDAAQFRILTTNDDAVTNVIWSKLDEEAGEAAQ